MLPIQAIVDQRAVAMKEYSAFPKVPTLLLVEFYPSVEKQSSYSTTPADGAKLTASQRDVIAVERPCDQKSSNWKLIYGSIKPQKQGWRKEEDY